jgi:hypothetical protein
MRITLNEHQFQTVDKVVAEGTFGGTREEVLRHTVLKQSRHLLSGGGPFDPGPRPVLAVTPPTYGPQRLDFILKPVTTAVGGGDGFAVVERAC